MNSLVVAALPPDVLKYKISSEVEDGDLDAAISELSGKLTEVRDYREKLLRDVEVTHAFYRRRNPKLIQEANDVETELEILRAELAELLTAEGTRGAQVEEEEIERIVTHEEKRERKDRRKKTRELFRRLSMLCHPDRNGHLSQVTREALTAIFVEALECYKKNDADHLQELLTRAMLVRDGKLEEELAKQKRERLDSIISMLDRVTSELRNMQHSPGYVIYDCHSRGNMIMAQRTFTSVMKQHLDGQRSILQALEVQLKFHKERLNGTQ